MLFIASTVLAAVVLTGLDLAARARRRTEFRRWAATDGRDVWFRLAAGGRR